MRLPGEIDTGRLKALRGVRVDRRRYSVQTTKMVLRLFRVGKIREASTFYGLVS